MPIVLRGQHELLASLTHADRALRLGVRRGLRQAAEPVQRSAEELALEKIRRMPRSPKWARMRVGVTRDFVYVAPRQRGAKGRGHQSARRPNLADLLMDRAMQPALDQHIDEVEARLEELLDRISDEFNHGAV
jgi:hypothetical protein